MPPLGLLRRWDPAGGNPCSRGRSETVRKEGWRRNALNKEDALVSLHASTHTVLYTRGEEHADHGHLSAKLPSYRCTGGALEVPLAAPAQPKVAHHHHIAQQAWREGWGGHRCGSTYPHLRLNWRTEKKRFHAKGWDRERLRSPMRSWQPHYPWSRSPANWSPRATAALQPQQIRLSKKKRWTEVNDMPEAYFCIWLLCDSRRAQGCWCRPRRFRAAIPCNACSREELIYTVRWVYQHPNVL